MVEKSNDKTLLKLSKLNIIKLDPSIFLNLNNLQHIDMSNNAIVELNENLFNGLKTIKTIEMRKKMIEEGYLNAEDFIQKSKISNSNKI